jgi:hypothetical protein
MYDSFVDSHFLSDMCPLLSIMKMCVFPHGFNITLVLGNKMWEHGLDLTDYE